MAEGSVLSGLVSGALGDARGFLVGGALQSVVNAISGGSPTSQIMDALSDISEQLDEIQKTEKAILKELGNIEKALEQAILKQGLKFAIRDINDPYDELVGLIDNIGEKIPTGELDTLKTNYDALTLKIYDNVGPAAELIKMDFLEFMQLLAEELREARTDILNYNLSLCYALYKFSQSYRKAYDLLSFSVSAYPTLETTIEKVESYFVELINWKAAYVNSELTPFISALVDSNIDSFTIKTRVFCYGDTTIDEQGKSDGSYWLMPMKEDPFLHDYEENVEGLPMSSHNPQYIKVVKSDDFDIKNPIFNLRFESPAGPQSDKIGVGMFDHGGAIKTDFGEYILTAKVDDDHYVDGSEDWQLMCCPSSTVPPPLLKNFFCLYNPKITDKKDYEAYVTIGERFAIMKEFDDDDNQQFWTFDSSKSS